MKLHKIIKCIPLLFVLIPFSITLNGNEIDSLKTVLKTAKGEKRIETLNNLSEAYLKIGEFDEALTNAKKALKEIKSFGAKHLAAKSYLILCNYYFRRNNDSAAYYAKQASEIAHQTDQIEIEAQAENVQGTISYFKGEYQKTYKHWNASLLLYTKLNNLQKIAELSNRVGVIHKIWGEYDMAINYYEKALKIHEQRKDTFQMASTLANIGNLYFYMEIDLDKGLELYNKALEYFIAQNNLEMIANVKNSIGNVYVEKKENDLAQRNFEESLKIFMQIKNNGGIAHSYLNLAGVYQKKKEYKNALDVLFKAQEILNKLQDKRNYILSFAALAGIYKDMKQYSKSIEYYQKFIKGAEELKIRKELLDKLNEISEVYEIIGNYKQSLHYYKYYSQLRDTVLNDENIKQINEMEAKYENEKKENELRLQRSEYEKKESELRLQRSENAKKESELKLQLAENAKKESELKLQKAETEKQTAEAEKQKAEAERQKAKSAQQKQQQRIVIIGAIIIVVFVLSVSLLIYRQFRIKKKANVLLQQQNDKIAKQNKQITDSISYASIIQSAILTPNMIFDEMFPEHFILYKPKHIVSGDFYWMMKRKDKILLVVADCTGHGVPGAFMSMLGMAYINEVVNMPNLNGSDEILNVLRKKVITSLHQTGDDVMAKDGMDLSLCIIDRKEQNIQFSGAYNPLYIATNNEMKVIKGDKLPIGYHIKKETKFTQHNISYNIGDKVYLFSDGFPDQVGGEERRKFMTKRFMQYLHDIHHHSMAKQKELLETTLNEWQGDFEQVDDITILGVKL